MTTSSPKRLTLTRKGDLWLLAGHCDEHADFTSLERAPAGLCKLDMGGVVAFNSPGVMKFLRCLSALSRTKIEYHRCTREFVELLNVLPELSGTTAERDAVQSLFVPYRCRQCDLYQEHLVASTELKQVGSGVTTPQKRCAQCGGECLPELNGDEYFSFFLR